MPSPTEKVAVACLSSKEGSAFLFLPSARKGVMLLTFTDLLALLTFLILFAEYISQNKKK